MRNIVIGPIVGIMLVTSVIPLYHRHLLSRQHESGFIATMVDDLLRDRRLPFAHLIDLRPRLRPKMEKRLERVLEDGSLSAMRAEAGRILEENVPQPFSGAIATASDESVLAFATVYHRILRRLAESDPERCFRFETAGLNPSLVQYDLTTRDLVDWSRTSIAILAGPRRQGEERATDDDVADFYSSVFKRLDDREARTVLLDPTYGLTPEAREKGCRAALTWYSMLLQLPPERAASIARRIYALDARR